MSWDCPLCKTENTSGSRVCEGCEAELPPRYDGPEIEPDAEPELDPARLTMKQIEELEALGERFSTLIRGKSMRDVVGKDFQLPTEIYLRAAIARVAQGADLPTQLLIAVSWGMFIAEQGASMLNSRDLSKLH